MPNHAIFTYTEVAWLDLFMQNTVFFTRLMLTVSSLEAIS